MLLSAFGIWVVVSWKASQLLHGSMAGNGQLSLQTCTSTWSICWNDLNRCTQALLSNCTGFATILVSACSCAGWRHFAEQDCSPSFRAGWLWCAGELWRSTCRTSFRWSENHASQASHFQLCGTHIGINKEVEPVSVVLKQVMSSIAWCSICLTLTQHTLCQNAC